MNTSHLGCKPADTRTAPAPTLTNIYKVPWGPSESLPGVSGHREHSMGLGAFSARQVEVQDLEAGAFVQGPEGHRKSCV